MGHRGISSINVKKIVTVSLPKIMKVIKGHDLLDVLNSLCSNDVLLSYVVDEERQKLKVVVADSRRIDIALLFESLTSGVPDLSIPKAYTKE